METTQTRPVRVLVVDDDPTSLKALEALLREKGWEVVALDSSIAAIQRLAAEDFNVVLIDIEMRQLSSLELLTAVKHRRPQVEVIMMTGPATVQMALAAVKAGAYDYLTKPFEDWELVARAVSRAAERKALCDRNRELEILLGERSDPSNEGLVCNSGVMRDVMRMIDAVAYSSAPVLVCGESGTGKERVARDLHNKSPRRSRPFVAINCGALTEALLEAELFGQVKGALAGALSDQKWLFEAADGGTLFLDEFGDIPPATQVRVLRVLQEGEINRVGSDEAIRVDVRVIAATGRDLPKLVKAGRFREDLLNRFTVIAIPPLRDRIEDVPLLAHQFMRRYADRTGKKVKHFSPGAIEFLCGYRWPRNVWELECAIERAVVICRGDTITPRDLPPAVLQLGRSAVEVTTPPWIRQCNAAAEEGLGRATEEPSRGDDMEGTQPRPVRVLVLDDDPTMVKALEALLREKGWEVIALDSPIEAIQRLAAEAFDVALLDLAMPPLVGLELLTAVKHRRPEVEIVMMIGHTAVEEAVELVAKVSKAAERKALFDRNRELETLLGGKSDPSKEELVGNSVAMRDVMRTIDAVACSSAAVLVHGENNTGKTLVARTLHNRSPRRSQPFVEFGCYAPTEALLESELFGHVKGAFAGALGDKKGPFEAADGGTIYLDQIGDLPLATQVRVLHLLQEGAIKRVGSDERIRVDVRVIASTARDLPKLVKAGCFREDLFNRFNVIDIPPLRDRLEDVPLLAHHFLRYYANRLGKKVRTFSPEAIGLLCGYRWPRNVWGLECAIERAVVLCRGDVIMPGDLPPAVSGRTAPLVRVLSTTGEDAAWLNQSYAAAKEQALRRFEKRYVEAAMRACDNKVSAAARKVGMDRSDFEQVLRKHWSDLGPDDGDTKGEDAAWLDQGYAVAKEQALRWFEKSYVEALMRACDNNISAAARKARMDRSNFKRVLRKYRSDVGPDDGDTDPGADVNDVSG